MQNSIRPPCPSERRGSATKGSVAVLTLWVVVFLALLASAIAKHVETHLQIVAGQRWGFLSRAVGMRALAEALDVLKHDTNEESDSFREGWADNESRFKEMAYAGVSFSVVHPARDESSSRTSIQYGLTDEEGKVNLNKASPTLLAALFQSAGITAEQANDLARFIVDWRDENATREGGPGPETCAGESIPRRCKNAAFESVEELWWMPGMTATLFDAVRGEVTLYGTGAVNANTATPLALRAVGLSANGADQIVAWRASPGRSFENSSAISARADEIGLSVDDKARLGAAVASGLLGTRSNFYRGDVEVTIGHVTRNVASFIVDRKMQEMKRWRE